MNGFLTTKVGEIAVFVMGKRMHTKSFRDFTFWLFFKE